MKMLRYVIPIVIQWLLCSCASQEEAQLQSALELAKENRGELEKVLHHYASDSEKEEAAKFLISNMPYHYSYTDSTYVKKLGEAVDSCVYIYKQTNKFEETRPLLDYIVNDLQGKPHKIVADINIIKADDLIAHIDTAFRRWKNSPWYENIDFENFCEWILPYKIEELQPFDDWISYLNGKFDAQLTTLKYCNLFEHSIPRACLAVNNCLRDSLHPDVREMSFYPTGLSMKKRLDIPFGICKQFSTLATAVMRSEGIPVTQDFTPLWSFRNVGHEWNVVFDNSGKTIQFGGADTNPGEAHKMDERMSKIFRRTYISNPLLLDLIKKEKYAPYPFNSPFVKDVTAEYIECSDHEIVLDKKMDGYVYLALSNRDSWSPVDFSYAKDGNVVFKDVGHNSVYIVIRYKSADNYEILTEPFLITKESKVHYYTPDETKTVKAEMFRKYPVLPHVYEMAVRIKDGEFHASDDENFNEYEIIHKIEDASARVHEIEVDDSVSPYRYWRYKQDRKFTFCNISEIEFIDSCGEKIFGDVIGIDGYWGENSNSTKDKVFDGDPLTTFDAPMQESAWVGMDFGKPVKPYKIRYLGRGDGNTIEEGDEYELLYFRNKRWNSLGKQIGKGMSVIYDNVPSNALLLLRDLTKGKEERVFTYEDGEQIWR